VTSPRNLLDQFRSCVLDHQFPLTEVLSLVTSNTAAALKLNGSKGHICQGFIADVVVLDKDTLEPREVISAGRRLMKGGETAVTETFLKDSNREISLIGGSATKRDRMSGRTADIQVSAAGNGHAQEQYASGDGTPF